MNEAIQRAITAMRALCVHWDTPAWKQVKHTGKFIADLRAAADALAAQPAAEPASIHLQDLKNALADAKALRDQLRLMEEHAKGEVWRWQGDGTDNLDSMGARMGVLIYASDLKALIAAQPARAGGDAPSPDAWREPTTYLRRLGDALEALCRGHRPTDAMIQAWLMHEDGGLQEFCIDNGPTWAQGCAVIDAAAVLASQPTEGVAHEPTPAALAAAPQPAAAEPETDRNAALLAANTDLLTYVLQGDVHNRLTPRVIDIAYTAFIQAKAPNDEDGGPSDWFNDTKPMIERTIEKLRRDLFAERDARKVEQPAASTVPATSERGRQLESALEHLAQTAFATKDWQYARDALAGKVAAPAAVERGAQPLTDERVLDVADDFRSQYMHAGTTFDEFDALGFARAIEREHGIGSSKEGGNT